VLSTLAFVLQSELVTTVDPVFRAVGLVVLPLYWSYLLGTGGAAALATARFLRASSSHLRVQPGHPDGCGGLEPIGTFCLFLSAPFLLAGLILTFVAVSSAWHPLLRDPNLIEPLRHAARVGLLVCVAPFAALGFFWPLWGLHLCMAEQRDAYESSYADYLGSLLRDAEAARGDAARSRDAIAAINSAKSTLAPDKIGFPVWPFDVEIVLKFSVPQITALAATLWSQMKVLFAQ
jgi:hypothetical protein